MKDLEGCMHLRVHTSQVNLRLILSSIRTLCYEEITVVMGDDTSPLSMPYSSNAWMSPLSRIQILQARLRTVGGGSVTFLVDPSWRTPSCTATTAIVWIPDLNCASHVRGCCITNESTSNPKAALGMMISLKCPRRHLMSSFSV